jgi:hypothetical protein
MDAWQHGRPSGFYFSKPGDMHARGEVGGILRPCLDAQKDLKFFAQYSSHQIFRHIHGALNVGKK